MLPNEYSKSNKIVANPEYGNPGAGTTFSLPGGGHSQQQIAANVASHGGGSVTGNIYSGGLGGSGAPEAPTLQSFYNSDGSVKDQFQFGDWQDDYGVQYDPEGQAQWGLDEMKERANGTAWEDAMMQQADLSALGQKEQAFGAMQGQLAGARTQMQMRGGMGGGARERLAASGAQAVADQQAAIGRQTQLAKLGIGAQAQDRRDNMLGAYQGAQASHLGQQMSADTYTAGQKLGHKKSQLGWDAGMMESDNAQKTDIWKTKMKQYGADETADAIEASAPKKSWYAIG